VTIEVLDQLAQRLPEGELRGDTLFRLALLRSTDKPQKALTHAVEAGRHHVPEALELAEMLYQHLQTGEALNFSRLSPELLYDLLGIEVSGEAAEEEVEEQWELDDHAQVELNGDEVISFDDEASFIEFAFEDEDEDADDVNLMDEDMGELDDAEGAIFDLAGDNAADDEEVSILNLTENGAAEQP